MTQSERDGRKAVLSFLAGTLKTYVAPELAPQAYDAPWRMNYTAAMNNELELATAYLEMRVKQIEAGNPLLRLNEVLRRTQGAS